MMVELARLQRTEELVKLRHIAKICGLSNNYLGQLAISLKDDGLVIGVSGKKGGYKLARMPEEISLHQIIRAVQGPLAATACAVNPNLCLNAEFCEARTIWVLISEKIQEVLEGYTLADLIEKRWMSRVKQENPDSKFLDISTLIKSGSEFSTGGCQNQRTE
ncbi:MAG: Rrf2 family transcriptional regulator [candidate division Zixibacteria bacterium]|nr:Rrf2 family transcriptional regulator [candidate division Zixibacteria bacterium]